MFHYANNRTILLLFKSNTYTNIVITIWYLNLIMAHFYNQADNTECEDQCLWKASCSNIWRWRYLGVWMVWPVSCKFHNGICESDMPDKNDISYINKLTIFSKCPDCALKVPWQCSVLHASADFGITPDSRTSIGRTGSLRIFAFSWWPTIL